MLQIYLIHLLLVTLKHGTVFARLCGQRGRSKCSKSEMFSTVLRLLCTFIFDIYIVKPN